MSVPVVPVRCCRLAVVIERDLGEATIPSPTEEGRYSRHRLTFHPGSPLRSSTTNGTSSHNGGGDNRSERGQGAPGWVCKKQFSPGSKEFKACVQNLAHKRGRGHQTTSTTTSTTISTTSASTTHGNGHKGH